MNHPINYCNLYEGRRFVLKGKPNKVYVKIANSHAICENTREDAIFCLSEKCFPCGNNKRLFNEVTHQEAKLYAGIA